MHKIENNLKNLSYDVSVKYTSLENNATNIIEEYKEKYDILIICGGDGTVNQGIQGVYDLDKKVPVGIIPIGTVNDFAKSLGVSFDKMDISNNINKYKDKQVDLGLINNKIFNYSVTLGIFSKTSYQTSTKWKNKIGRLAYLLASIKEFFNYPTYNLDIQCDEKELKGEFVFVSISNSQYVAGFNMFKHKKVELDDGKFEMVLVKKPTNVFELIKLTLMVITGKFDDKNIYYFQTSKININSTDEIQLAVDGEYGGNSKNIEIQNLRKHVNYIVPTK